MVSSSPKHPHEPLNEILEGIWSWWAIFAAPRFLDFSLGETGLTGRRDRSDRYHGRLRGDRSDRSGGPV